MNQFIIAAVFSALVSPFSLLGQTDKVPVEVSIDNLRSSKGNIIVSVFKNEKSFEQETPEFERFFSKKEIKKGKFKTTLLLPPGTYGIAILDDENEDRKMNYSLIGIPQEGYGFSDFEHTGYSKPKFSNFAFKLKKGKKILKAIKLRYF